MLPALNHRPNLQTNMIDQLKDQLDYAARHIEEEKRERMRMREQLGIQNEIINKVYARLNQLEEDQAESSKVMSNILQSSLLQHKIDSRDHARMVKSTDIDDVRKNFKKFTVSLKEETGQIRSLTNETHSSLINVQEYLKALRQSDQSQGNRMTTLETNTIAAMECIKSLQNNTNRVQSRLNNLETMTSSREEEVTASLQDVANCMGLAKTERSQLQQLISDSTLNINQLKLSLDEKLQKSRKDMEMQRQKKDILITQSLEELAECYRSVDRQISAEVAGSFQDTKTLITALQASIVQEKSVRLDWETKLRRDTANVLGNIRQNLREQMTQYINVYEGNKTKVDSSIKQLNQSISLIEQSGETNKNGLEHILQAEIKSRTKRFNELEESLNTARTALGALDTRREEHLKRLKDDLLKEIDSFRRSAIDEISTVSNRMEGVRNYTTEQVEKSAQQNSLLMRSTEERITHQMKEQIQETQEQIDVITETLIDDRMKTVDGHMAELAIQVEHIENKLKLECDDRKCDMEVLNSELSGKQSSVSYESEMITLRAKIGSCNSNVYEVEERMTVIEANSEENVTRLSEKIRGLQDQLNALSDLTEPLKDRDLTLIIDDMQLMQIDVRNLQTALEPTRDISPPTSDSSDRLHPVRNSNRNSKPGLYQSRQSDDETMETLYPEQL